MTAKIKKKSGKMKNFLKKGEFKDEASEVQFIVVFFSIYLFPFSFLLQNQQNSSLPNMDIIYRLVKT